MKRYVKASELDERYSFNLDDEFEIYLDTLAEYVPCYVTESDVLSNGAGVVYNVIVAVPRNQTHWQIADDITRNLKRYINEQTDGSDYTGIVEEAEAYEIFDPALDSSEIYGYDVTIVPLQNIGPYGDFGIDAGLV